MGNHCTSFTRLKLCRSDCSAVQTQTDFGFPTLAQKKRKLFKRLQINQEAPCYLLLYKLSNSNCSGAKLKRISICFQVSSKISPPRSQTSKPHGKTLGSLTRLIPNVEMWKSNVGGEAGEKVQNLWTHSTRKCIWVASKGTTGKGVEVWDEPGKPPRFQHSRSSWKWDILADHRISEEWAKVWH